jgi:hypothetical protein
VRADALSDVMKRMLGEKFDPLLRQESQLHFKKEGFAWLRSGLIKGIITQRISYLYVGISRESQNFIESECIYDSILVSIRKDSSELPSSIL